MLLANEPTTELVITAPKPFGTQLAYRTGCRMTMGVLVELLVQSKKQVVISAPFLQYGFGISAGALANAVKFALERGVNVDIVSTGRGLETINTDMLLQSATGVLRLYRPAANIEDERRLGSHAKFCISDGNRAYVGSANLTGPGLSEHLEMGLLVNNLIARQITEFWLYCVEVGLFVQT